MNTILETKRAWYKKINAFDQGKLDKEYANIKETDLILKIPGTDIVAFRGHNKVILPGAGFTARAHFDIPRNEITPSYNSALQLENSVTETPSSKEKVYLFCIGTDGCGKEGSDVRKVNYGKWIPPESLIPFRYPLESEDLSGSLRDIYFGRLLKDDRVAYYFKAFETVPVFTQKYTDGTVVDENVYDSSKTDEIESYIELKLKVEPDDCREWFKNTTGINDALVNTFSLCTCWAKTFNGQIYYQDIRPLTKYNIPNEYLIDLTKGLDISYLLFY